MACVCVLTVQEAVVFEAASAEQSVEGVQALFALHRASVRTVDVRRALRGQRAGKLLLRQLLVPDTHTHTQTGHFIDIAVNRPASMYRGNSCS